MGVDRAEPGAAVSAGRIAAPRDEQPGGVHGGGAYWEVGEIFDLWFFG